MSIAFRSASTDSNTAGSNLAYATLAIAPPAGMANGDFLVAAITIYGGTAVSVTAPTGWILLRRVDNGTTVSLAIYYRWAATEPANWVWSFGASGYCSGGVRAYTGVDPFTPIDAEAGITLASTVSQTVPSITTSTPETLLVASLGAQLAGTVTQPAGWSKRYTRRFTGGGFNLGISLNAGLDTLQSAVGPTAIATFSLDAASLGANHVLALRPAAGKVSTDQSNAALKGLFPVGADEFYDWNTLDMGAFFQALGDCWKAFGYDVIDLLRREFLPSTAVLKLPDWETALGIGQVTAAPTNIWYATRQAAVVSKLRESGPPTIASVRSVVEPLLGFSAANIGTLQVLETNRAALTALHTYSPRTLAATIPSNSNVVNTIYISDDGQVSAAGIQLVLSLTHANPEQVSVTVVGPPSSQTLQTGTCVFVGGSVAVTGIGTRFSTLVPGQQISQDGFTWFTIALIASDTALTLASAPGGNATTTFAARLPAASVTWPAGTLPRGALVATATYWYEHAISGASKGIFGTWTVTVSTGATGGTITALQAFIEGAGKDSGNNDGLGCSVYEWGVFADPTLTNAPDLVAVQRALEHITPSTSRPRIILGSATVSAGQPLAIPDDPNCIPDRVIPS